MLFFLFFFNITNLTFVCWLLGEGVLHNLSFVCWLLGEGVLHNLTFVCWLLGEGVLDNSYLCVLAAW